MMKEMARMGLAAWSMLLVACSGNDYLQALPDDSAALLAVDVPAFCASAGDETDVSAWLKQLLPADEMDKTGIGITDKIYLFETSDGSTGVLARVESEANVRRMFDRMAENGSCQPPVERNGARFTVVKGQWVAGFNGSALLMVGPTVASEQANAVLQVGRYLRQDGKKSTRLSRMLSCIDSIDAPLACVAQASTLPEMVAAPLMVGIPQGADASQLMISAGMAVEKRCLRVRAHTFSYNKRIDEQLQKAKQKLRKVGSRYAQCLRSDVLMYMLANVEGEQFLPIARQNPSLKMLIGGANAKIDMSKIIENIDGNLLLSLSEWGGGQPRFGLAAEVKSAEGWQDVAQSADKSVSFKVAAPTNGAAGAGRAEVVFGMNGADDRTFLAPADGPMADKRLPGRVAEMAESSTISIVCNLNRMGNETLQVMRRLAGPLLGQVETVVCTVE